MDKNLVTEKVNKAIESIRPYLVTDGGDISVLEITEDLTVKVQLHGACNGCPFSFQTLKAGVEQAIRRELPELKDLVAID
ncbi:MAG: NifU family protein [Bacteroidetes bacterium]|jgi:Fe-S cluster biogenesis protein NfuA|nr:NifU family protein [Bacteroidota bacterium]